MIDYMRRPLLIIIAALVLFAGAAAVFWLSGTRDGMYDDKFYIYDGAVYRAEPELRKAMVLMGADKLNSLYDEYLKGLNVYYAVIPDKNYYASAKYGYPSMDYTEMLALLRENITHIEEIELFDCLELEDYYRTDLHWRQERLDHVLSRLGSALGVVFPSLGSYEINAIENYLGSYYTEGMKVKPEELFWLTDENSIASSVFNLETNSRHAVYTPEKAEAGDGYDIFTGGNAAFLEITNPLCESGGELVIFRDSFCGSLAPLMLSAYSKITLIDLRFVSSSLLTRLISFKDQDVLFLYSTLVFNNSAMLK